MINITRIYLYLFIEENESMVIFDKNAPTSKNFDICCSDH